MIEKTKKECEGEPEAVMSLHSAWHTTNKLFLGCEILTGEQGSTHAESNSLSARILLIFLPAFPLCPPAFGVKTTAETLLPLSTGNHPSYSGREGGLWFPAFYQLRMFLSSLFCHPTVISLSLSWPEPWELPGFIHLPHTLVESNLSAKQPPIMC